MNRRRDLLATAALYAVSAQARSPAAPVGELKALGGDRYQVGRIVVDKRARSFTAPGTVLVLDVPLEYLATTPGGSKAYETLLELNSTGSEFNLACILIGLERDPKLTAAREAGTGPIPGPRVNISITWSAGGKRQRVSAAQALLNPGTDIKAESIEWVYIGSPATDPQGRFGADARGTLVGFKPDDYNVIESAVGVGIGAYGSIRGNSVLPPVGSPIEMIVQALPPVK